MVITNNKKLAEKIKSVKAFGVDKNYNQRNFPGKYDVKELGFNYGMSEIHASIGVEQMKKLNFFLKQREKNFLYLFNALNKNKNFFIISNKNKKILSSNYCMSIILKKNNYNRTSIIKNLNKNGIGTSIYYPKPVPLMSYYKKKYNYKNSEFKNALKISERSISFW